MPTNRLKLNYTPPRAIQPSPVARTIAAVSAPPKAQAYLNPIVPQVMGQAIMNPVAKASARAADPRIALKYQYAPPIAAMGRAKPPQANQEQSQAQEQQVQESQDQAQYQYADPGFGPQEQGAKPQASETDEREAEDNRQTEDFQREQEERKARSEEEESASAEEEYAHAEEEYTAEEDESAFTGEIPVSAYMHNNLLSCTTARLTPWGIMPATITAKMKSQYPDGPVSVGSDPVTDAAIQGSKGKLLARTVDEQQKAAAQSLVCRARCGDQNAMAIISMVTQNAKSSARAKNAYMHIRQYIDANPSNGSTFGADPQTPPNTLNRSAVQFADGGPLNNHRISDILNTFTGPKSRKRKLVTFGFMQFNLDDIQIEKCKKQLDKLGAALLDFGRALGLGRAIQIVRSNGPISALSSKASWELGE